MEPSKINVEGHTPKANVSDLSLTAIKNIGKRESKDLYSFFVSKISSEKREDHYLSKGYRFITSDNIQKVQARLAKEGVNLTADDLRYAAALGIIPRSRFIAEDISEVATQVKAAASFFNLAKQRGILESIKNHPDYWMNELASENDLAAILTVLDLNQPFDQDKFGKEKKLAQVIIDLFNYEMEVTKNFQPNEISEFRKRLKEEIQEKIKSGTPLENISVDEIKQKIQESRTTAKKEELAKGCGEIFAAKAMEYFKEQNIPMVGNPKDLPAFKVWQDNFDKNIKPLQDVFKDWGLQEQFINLVNDHFKDVSFSDAGKVKSAFVEFAKAHNKRGAELQSFERREGFDPFAKVILAEKFKKIKLDQDFSSLAPTEADFQEECKKKIADPVNDLMKKFSTQGVDEGTFITELRAELAVFIDSNDGSDEGVKKFLKNFEGRLEKVVAEYAKHPAKTPLETKGVPPAELKAHYNKSFQEYLQSVSGEVGNELAVRFQEALSAQQSHIEDADFSKLISYKKLEVVRKTIVDKYVNDSSYSKSKIRDCIDLFFQNNESLPKDPHKLFEYLTSEPFLKEFEAHLDKTSCLDKLSYGKLWAMCKGWDYDSSATTAAQKADPAQASQPEAFIGNKRNATEFLEYMKSKKGYSEDSKNRFQEAINKNHGTDMDYYHTAHDDKSLFRAVGTAFLMNLANFPPNRKGKLIKKLKSLEKYFTSSNDPKDKEVYDNVMKIILNESLINPKEILKVVQEHSEIICQFFQSLAANAVKSHVDKEEDLKALTNVTREKMDQFINAVKKGLSFKEAHFLDPEVLILLLEEILPLKIRNYDLEEKDSGLSNLKNDSASFSIFLMHSLFTPAGGDRIDHFDIMAPSMMEAPQYGSSASATTSQPASAAAPPSKNKRRDLLGKKINAVDFAGLIKSEEQRQAQKLKEEPLYVEWLGNQSQTKLDSLKGAKKNLTKVFREEAKERLKGIPKDAPSNVEKGVEVLNQNKEASKLDYFPIPADGHCLFRAIGTACVMKFLQGDVTYKQDLAQKFKDLNVTFKSEADEQVFKGIKNSFIKLMREIQLMKNPAERMDAIRDATNSDVIVKFFRHLAVNSLRAACVGENLATFEASYGNLEKYCEGILGSAYGAHPEIGALWEALGFSINVIDLDDIGKSGEKPVEKIDDLVMKGLGTSEGKFGTIYLILKPGTGNDQAGGHYDLALPATA